MTLPRPELSETMGIAYRRIPILAIGRDIYADTSLIASTLERRYPASAGYGTLFPPRKGGGSSDTGMVKTLAMYYFDRTVFPLGALSIPFQKFSETFAKDRADVSYLVFCQRIPFSQWRKYLGKSIDMKALPEVKEKLKSELASHIVRRDSYLQVIRTDLN